MPVLIYPNVESTYGNVDSVFESELHSVTTASSATVLSPPGFYFVVTGAHNTVQYTPDAGTTFRTLVGTSSGGMVFSDGKTTQITNDSTGGTSAFYTQIRGNV